MPGIMIDDNGIMVTEEQEEVVVQDVSSAATLTCGANGVVSVIDIINQIGTNEGNIVLVEERVTTIETTINENAKIKTRLDGTTLYMTDNGSTP